MARKASFSAEWASNAAPGTDGTMRSPAPSACPPDGTMDRGANGVRNLGFINISPITMEWVVVGEDEW